MICQRCHRKLKSEQSIKIGMGPVCKRKHDKEVADREFLKKQITIFEFIDEDRQAEQQIEH